MINYDNPKLPTVQSINAQTVLFSIPSFSHSFTEFSEAVKPYMNVLSNCKNLIIDIRGNTGGNAVYLSFIELLADTTVFPGSQGEVLASEATKQYFMKNAKFNQAVFGPVVDRINSNMGKIVPGPKYPDQNMELIDSNIEEIAILIDGACASAAESFILHAKSVNNQIKTFGSPTYGMIDNTDVNSIKIVSSKSQNIFFAYPTSTWGSSDPNYPYGYNENGIQPDIMIDDDVSDKVKFIIEYFTK